MFHDDMTLSRLRVYSQSIEESKHRRMARNLKGGSNDQEKPSFKGEQNFKPTCVICGKKHYGECLLGTGSCFGCGKEGNKVGDCPMIASTGREGKQVAPSVPKDDAPTKRHFYAPY